MIGGNEKDDVLHKFGAVSGILKYLICFPHTGDAHTHPHKTRTHSNVHVLSNGFEIGAKQTSGEWRLADSETGRYPVQCTCTVTCVYDCGLCAGGMQRCTKEMASAICVSFRIKRAHETTRARIALRSCHEKNRSAQTSKLQELLIPSPQGTRN